MNNNLSTEALNKVIGDLPDMTSATLPSFLAFRNNPGSATADVSPMAAKNWRNAND